MLPTLAQCIDSPTLQGCSAVLPTLVACAGTPQAPGCAVVTTPTLTEPNKAVDTALETTINAVGKSNQVARLDDEKKDEKKDNKDDSTQAGASTVQGEKKNELVKKTYCN